MNIEELGSILDVDLIIRKIPGQARYVTSFKSTEVSESIFLAGVYGNAENPEDSINDYVNKIKGKKIVINATRPERKEFNVPITLTR